MSSRLAKRTDPEDIVMSVYGSFFREAAQGRYSLQRIGDLWRLLAGITRHKTLRNIRHSSAGRRSIKSETRLDLVDEAVIARGHGDDDPQVCAAYYDELTLIRSKLDPRTRRVLELRLQGVELVEIARETGQSERSVGRALARIRERVSERFLDESAADRQLPSKQPIAADGPLLSHTDFQLHRMIGAGRMGKVYEATQHSTGRKVAVKFLRKSYLQYPRLVHRFMTEAWTVARLNDPRVVSTQGLGAAPGGSYFIVMELVEGPNLATVITTRAIDFHDAVRWTIQICRAIESAHAMNVVHCDLKPANILLDDEQRIRVTDFGLARSLDQEMPGAAEIEGTARFMAPEQVSRHWGVIDRRTDVYGIGAVLLNLITGHAPFASGRNAEVLAQVVSHLPVTGLATIDTSVPDRLIEVCRKSLAKAPVDRYQTVTDLRAALECVERPSW